MLSQLLLDNPKTCIQCALKRSMLRGRVLCVQDHRLGKCMFTKYIIAIFHLLRDIETLFYSAPAKSSNSNIVTILKNYIVRTTLLSVRENQHI